jgi:hypothetical protein
VAQRVVQEADAKLDGGGAGDGGEARAGHGALLVEGAVFGGVGRLHM